MTRWLLAPEAADDLERLTDFLLEADASTAVDTVDLILDALAILTRHPRIGRPLPQGLRELVISRGQSGYLALYSYDEAADIALVLALRHQREEDNF
ncbi:type II toxin-antitoxin system RelE/ParE family toxin [Azoarcus indigens]|uniref:Plasmid stabilization system protein ParE n=1 Tax=Azoarcus indigens TaxID=29545 RepID=A0A4R6EFP9_9RHOO|nr:type II toxin-antitoxin system RelE/ParE family toxin [Azoarcus indigens]NMG63562.1 type II toxin-antitoxin system RelE/ParE family toxin [Azoarcus indigens]TDN57114.1 plasmid stabilization system protein ParE [Azoarcus indigens]